MRLLILSFAFLKLLLVTMRIPNNRKGFKVLAPKTAVISEPITVPFKSTTIVYWNAKLSHNGIIGFKTFEGYSRKMRDSSMANLLNHSSFSGENLDWLINQYYACQADDERSKINDQAVSMLDQESFDVYLTKTRQTRHLNSSQSRKVANIASKLAYYSQKRIFKSKKTGTYSMRVAFLTLTAPESAEPSQVLKAFNHFLDYLQRTANCIYVWKKELGDESERLHFHIIINNFIPYYIIAWKWKRLLLAENVVWPTNELGKDTSSHYRIELPRNKKQTARYIAKYLSKAYDLPGSYGYISGHSSLLDSLKDTVLIEGSWSEEEMNNLVSLHKVIRRDYVTIVCCDLLHIKSICPKLGALFEEQYIKFSEIITLPQRFHEI